MKKSKWIGMQPEHPANRARVFCRTGKRWLAETEGLRNRLTPGASAHTGRAGHEPVGRQGHCGSTSLAGVAELFNISNREAEPENVSPEMGSSSDTDLAPSRRRRPKREPCAYARSHDIARILPLSVRQIEAMAAEGSLPAFKLPGCSVWLFDEAAIRRMISIHSTKQNHKRGVPCHTRSTMEQTTISTSGVVDGTSVMSSTALNSGSRLERLMSARHGRNGTDF
jgi:hypothetical protein